MRWLSSCDMKIFVIFHGGLLIIDYCVGTIEVLLTGYAFWNMWFSCGDNRLCCHVVSKDYIHDVGVFDCGIEYIGHCVGELHNGASLALKLVWIDDSGLGEAIVLLI